MGHVLADLVGKTITEIHWTESTVVFTTDGGTFTYEVEGDCCSYSYFHDFFGVRNLLDNGPVVAVGDVELRDDDPRFKSPIQNAEDWDVTAVYGYELVTEHPRFGEVTSVLSFRNNSNGYYGGWMDRVAHEVAIPSDAKLLTEDFYGE